MTLGHLSYSYLIRWVESKSAVGIEVKSLLHPDKKLGTMRKNKKRLQTPTLVELIHYIGKIASPLVMSE